MPGSMKSNKSYEIRRSSQVQCLLSNSVQEPASKPLNEVKIPTRISQPS